MRMIGGNNVEKIYIKVCEKLCINPLAPEFSLKF